ncbi:hypothetical protein BDV93DRAFT_592491 [Ceratobasidium sp. AG-I]|nr:hypothetical protein BDV93DRAFT_592491 [Ceratobasidium sp. AG-I]
MTRENQPSASNERARRSGGHMGRGIYHGQQHHRHGDDVKIKRKGHCVRPEKTTESLRVPRAASEPRTLVGSLLLACLQHPAISTWPITWTPSSAYAIMIVNSTHGVASGDGRLYHSGARQTLYITVGTLRDHVGGKKFTHGSFIPVGHIVCEIWQHNWLKCEGGVYSEYPLTTIESHNHSGKNLDECSDRIIRARFRAPSSPSLSAAIELRASRAANPLVFVII